MSDDQNPKAVFNLSLDFDDHFLRESTDRNITPGEILRTEFMEPCGLSIEDLANLLHVPQTALDLIFVANPHPITVDLVLRLGRLFGMSPEFWMDLHMNYELRQAFKNSELIKKIGEEVPKWPAANRSNVIKQQ